jgi:hypothetical protein
MKSAAQARCNKILLAMIVIAHLIGLLILSGC